MENQSVQIINDAFNGANNGSLHFGQVVALMREAGVESYGVDYRGHRTTCYLANGQTHTLPMDASGVEVAAAFDADALKAAILGAQQGRIMYPEFKRLSMAAGCAGYTVWIAGAHVSYLGRKGETHVERFPGQP